MKKSLQHAQDSRNPLTILIVEDSKGLNRLIRKRLERHGFLTEQALNGAETLAYIEENPFEERTAELTRTNRLLKEQIEERKRAEQALQ